MSSAATVRITADGLSKSTVKVKVSGRVTFVNEDAADHQIGSGCGQLNTPVLVAGTSFVTQMSATPQTCEYADVLNPSETKWQGAVKIVSGGGGSSGSWIVGAGGVVAHPSVDGQTFALEPAPTEQDLLGLFCFEPRGWAVGTQGAVLITADGKHWTSGSSGVSTTLRAVAFASHEIGLAVGDGGTVLRSIDGGVTWTSIASGTTAVLRAVDFADNRQRAWIGGDAGTLLVSEDGGVSFAQAAGVPSDAAIHGVRFAAHNPRAGVAVGDAGTVLLSVDAGATWTPAAQAAPGTLRGLQISEDGSRVVAVGDAGLVWRSIDGGASWSAGDSGTANDLRAIGFGVDELEGWAVGLGGTLLHTLDGGESFETLDSPIAGDLFSAENER